MPRDRYEPNHDPSFEITDLGKLDRDLARAYAAAVRGEAALREAPAAHRDDEPLAPFRRLTGQRLYDALGALSPSVADAPLRDGLRRWVRALLLARVTRAVEGEIAVAAAEVSAPLPLPIPRLESFRAASFGLVAAETRGEREAWLAVATRRGPFVAPLLARRAALRLEASRRLGLEDADDGNVACAPSLLATAAARFLAESAGIAHAVQRDYRRRCLDDAAPSPLDVIAASVAREAPEGWPAALTERWLPEVLGPLAAALRVPRFPLPATVGASSYMRALEAFGYGARVAGASSALPFALARDPSTVSPHRFGFVFGALLVSRTFQGRALGLGARVADAQARVLARTALLAARLEAARFLMGRRRDPADFEELSSLAFGAPLPRELAFAWPAPHDDAAARVYALLTTPPLARSLVEKFDDDWFANPRVVMHLRALTSAPAFEPAAPREPLLGAEAPEPPDDPEAHAVALARSFEEQLA